MNVIMKTDKSLEDSGFLKKYQRNNGKLRKRTKRWISRCDIRYISARKKFGRLYLFIFS